MSTAYISVRAYDELKRWLSAKGYVLKEFPEGDLPYPAISSHPDIYISDTKNGLIRQYEISGNYPDYLGFNGVFLDKYFIHNLKYTSPTLISQAENMGLTLVNVRQGYTKCSCVVVDGSSIITADKGIISALSACPDIDVLGISEGHVLLDGFEYGFIGGASGRVGNSIVFNGDIKTHPDCDAIKAFIEGRGLEVVSFPGLKLYDIRIIFTE